MNAWYFLDSEKNGVKSWLMARTICLCACFNRLLGYHPVRSTTPVILCSFVFVRDNAHSNKRSEHHLARCPEYPNRDDADDEERFVEEHHRHFDAFMEQERPGTRYPARMRGCVLGHETQAFETSGVAVCKPRTDRGDA